MIFPIGKGSKEKEGNAMEELNIKKGFYRIELNKAVWDVPDKYKKLSPIGMGAYGQVW